MAFGEQVKELLQAIPEKYRDVAYSLFGILGVLLGATAVGFVFLPVAGLLIALRGR